MAVLEMKRIQLCALKNERKKILEFLQRRGAVEIHAQRNPKRFFPKPTLPPPGRPLKKTHRQPKRL